MPYRILIVDDEPDLEQLIRQKFRKEIRQNEFEFCSAYNGLQALDILQEDKTIDLVLTDINMPQMGGLALLKKICEMRNSILKAVVISAYGDMENIRTAMNRGAFDFVTKPINFEDLEITIRKCVMEIANLKLALEARTRIIAVQQELDIARNIQLSILPQAKNPFPDRTEFDLSALIIPAREVGGDFYDFFMIDDDHLGFCIGDVSGKGIPAAIFMAVCKTAIKSIAVKGLPVKDCFIAVNNTLVQESPLSIFVTAFYGVLNIQTGELEYCNAGHNPTYHINPSGEVNPLINAEGIPLGFRKDFQYGTQTISLKEGDTLFFHTDGVDEAMDKEENEFSEDRLKAALKQYAGLDLSKLNQSVLDKVQEFTGGIPQSDDITVMALRYSP
ncbi:MAG: PP2C family protein-serine/threonine phosphatase [Calditrichaceae bacterium]